MKFSKEELVVLNVLKASHRSMSIMELSEKSCFHFAPKLRVTIAVEILLQKKAIIEAGIHQSYSTSKSKSYIAYAPVVHSKELSEKQNQSHRETPLY